MGPRPGPPFSTLVEKKGLPKQLLSLDGGGVKGISSLLILEAIMKEVKEREIADGTNTSTDDRKPVDYFHLAAGTSTGGLIALMLFRLHMSVPEVKKKYESLAKDVFSPRIFGYSLHRIGTLGYYLGNGYLKAKAVFLNSQFSDEPLKEAIDKVVKEHGLDNDDKKAQGGVILRHKDAGKMIMCATLTGKGESVLFRSFIPYADAKPVSYEAKEAYDGGELENIDISTASRATSAAPTYLPQVSWQKMTFWDGGLLNNNPIHQLWAARYDTTDSSTASAPVVSCVLSLGTSWSKKQPSSIFRFFNTMSSAASYMTNTEAKHRDFERELNRLKAREPENKKTRYFRFNTPTDQEDFNLDDYKKMDKLAKITAKWLEEEEQTKNIQACARLLHPIKELK